MNDCTTPRDDDARGGLVITVCVPDIGDFRDVPVIEVLVKPGDAVAMGSAIVILESDKAIMEVPSSAPGFVETLEVRVGDVVSEGSILLTLRTLREPMPSATIQAPSAVDIPTPGADAPKPEAIDAPKIKAVDVPKTKALDSLLRWFCVPVVAVVAYLSAAFAIGFGLLITPVPMTIILFLHPLPGLLFGSYYGGVAAAAVAPTFKLATAIAVGVIAIAINVVAVTIEISRGDEPVRLVLEAIVILIGSISASVRVAKTPREAQPLFAGIARIAAVVYMAGYCANGFWFLAAEWSLIVRSLWNLLNPFLQLQALWIVLTTWQFWASVAVTVVAMSISNFAVKKLEAHAPAPSDD